MTQNTSRLLCKFMINNRPKKQRCTQGSRRSDAARLRSSENSFRLRRSPTPQIYSAVNPLQPRCQRCLLRDQVARVLIGSTRSKYDHRDNQRSKFLGSSSSLRVASAAKNSFGGEGITSNAVFPPSYRTREYGQEEKFGHTKNLPFR